MFNLKFIDTYQEEDEDCGSCVELLGQITIDDFEENFVSQLDYWTTPKEYLEQWYKEVEKVTHRKYTTGCLITSMSLPHKNNHLFCWVLYREDNIVYVQERLFFYDFIKEEFNLDKMGDYVSPRETITDEGDRISEWKTSIGEIEEFLSRLRNEIDRL